MARSVVVIAHNIRSAHNVGAILRTAEGLGINHVYLSGYTPYPRARDDERLPHLATKIAAQINKTALGAEKFQAWSHKPQIAALLNDLRAAGYEIAALELAPDANDLLKFKLPQKIALVLGSEVGGLSKKILDNTPLKLKITMKGQKESFNVSVAAAIAMHWLTSVK